MMAPKPLPSPRQVLTSLINSISAIRQSTQVSDDDDDEEEEDGNSDNSSNNYKKPRRRRDRSTNPLDHISPAHRHYFTTLHVIFPSLLLPALDLLDRGLVTRLELCQQGPAVEPGSSMHPQQQQQQQRLPTAGQGTDGRATTRSTGYGIYHVRSAQQQAGGRGNWNRGAAGAAAAAAEAGAGAAAGSGGGRLAYVIHLGAWNCTCAAFAFSAFPSGGGVEPRVLASSSSSSAAGAAIADRSVVDDDDGEESEEMDEDRADDWSFGGMSLDGLLPSHHDEGGREGVGGDQEMEAAGEDGGVPCCKHLLACLLADRWTALSRYVEVRTVQKEEMAGIVADV